MVEKMEEMKPGFYRAKRSVYGVFEGKPKHVKAGASVELLPGEANKHFEYIPCKEYADSMVEAMARTMDQDELRDMYKEIMKTGYK